MMPTTAPSAADRRLKFHGFALRIAVAALGLLTLVLFSSVVVSLIAQEVKREPIRDPKREAVSQPTIELQAIKPDLVTPVMKDAPPAPGSRVKQQLTKFHGTKVYHALYLPTNWNKDRRWPVIVEYPGNGPYENKLGDKNSGNVEDCNLAYGLSGGQDFICLTLPFVKPLENQGLENQRQWWGDPQATVDYCLAAVDLICTEFGGDVTKLVLCGFSRGAIACNYIGLRDDKIAKLWKCFIVHSHYDGVTRWPYHDSDADSARARLARLNGRAQWISHEGSVAATEQFVAESQKLARAKSTKEHPDGIAALGKFTFVALPFPNHTDTWALRDIAPRQEVRRWLREQLGT